MHAMKLGLGAKGTSKEGWESSDFPIVCEVCLGDNPYMNMMKQPFGSECKVCNRPFTVFKWKAGTKGRFKKTEVCQTCSKMKNCCQTCLLDLQYGLPTQVRDKYLQQQGGAAGGTAVAMQAPTSEVNREYYANLHANEIESSSGVGKSHNDTLLKLARRDPYYRRNLPRLCSFWVKGTCNRGGSCPYRHFYLPNEGDGADSTLAKQNMKDRYYGRNDPVANKIINRMEKQNAAPADGEVRTVYIGGLPPGTTYEEMQGIFYPYGEIDRIRVVEASKCAFVAYKTREAAVKAIDAQRGACTIKGAPVRVGWAKPHVQKELTDRKKGGDGASGDAAAPAPPPQVTTEKPSYPSMSAAYMGGNKRGGQSE